MPRRTEIPEGEWGMNHDTPSRRAQLEALKQRRRLAREAREREQRLACKQEVTYAQLVAEIKRVAMGDVMPTMAVFDHARPATWETAQELCQRLSVDWDELAVEMKLRTR